MRSFIGLDADGNLISTHTHKFAASGLGGWPEGFDLHNDGSTNPEVIAWRSRVKDKRIVKWVLYDCHCPASKGSCQCPSKRRVDHRWDGTGLVAKPATGALIDGAPYVEDSVVSRAPGVGIELKLASAETPDGTTVKVFGDPTIHLLEADPVELTFTGGITGAVMLYAPAQGIVGRVGVYGPFTKPITVKVRGWETT